MNVNLTRLSNKASVVLGLLSLALFWGSQAFGQEWSATQKEILRMEKAWWESLKKGDVDRCNTLVHKDGVFWFYTTKEPVNKTEFTMYMDHERIDSFEIKLPVVKVISNVAIVQYCYSYTTRVIPDVAYPGRLIHIWMKKDGKWQMINAMNASCSHLPNCP